MDIPLDEVVHFDVVTHHPTTGAVTDADSPPTFAIFEEATEPAMAGLSAVSMTKRTSMTGNYRGTYTASAANGFEVGKWYSVIAAGTVNAIQGKTVAQSFRLVAAEAVAGSPSVDVGALAGNAAAAVNLRQSASVIYVGSITGAATSTTLIDSGLTQAAPDFWIGRVLIFTTGTLKYQATPITGFTPASDLLTFTSLTGAPSGGDQFVIV